MSMGMMPPSQIMTLLKSIDKSLASIAKSLKKLTSTTRRKKVKLDAPDSMFR